MSPTIEYLTRIQLLEAELGLYREASAAHLRRIGQLTYLRDTAIEALHRIASDSVEADIVALADGALAICDPHGVL